MQFVLNPFSWSWATGDRAHIGILWGGVTLGLGLSLIPLLFVKGFRLPVRIFLAHLLAACAILINGLYLTMGLLLGFGDGAALKEMGVPPGLILLLGTAYILLSIAFWTRIQSDLGLRKDTPLPRRLAIISG